LDGLDVAEVSENCNTEVKVGQMAELFKSSEDMVMRAMKGEIGEVVVEYGKSKRAKTLSQPVRASLRLGK
jgi:hypothetical protein